MIGVKTARAMVIDDDPAEALPVLMALGRLGIGAVYLKCDKQEELPEVPLDGIRLLFLDMVLAGGTETGDVVGHLMAVLRRVLPTDPHPILIVLWTKHSEDYGEAFKLALATEFAHLPKGVVVTLEKSNFSGSDPETIQKIAEAITGHINERAPLNLIWHWEQVVHDAASMTTSALMGLALSRLGTDDSDVLPVLWDIIKAMVVAAGGESKHEAQEAVSLLFETLNFIHFDRVETTLETLPTPLEPAVSQLARALRVKTSPDDRAMLNTMILTSKVADEIPRPGSVYLRSKWPAEGKEGSTPFDQLAGTPKELVKEWFDPSRDEEYARSFAQSKVVQGPKAVGGCIADMDNRRNTLFAELEGLFSDALVEFTPICDFAQGKQAMTRLVRGFVVSEKHVHLLKQAPFLTTVGPIMIPEFDGPHYISLNARYVIGLPRKTALVRPALRIRQQVMAALQAWFASHAARPGYLFIDR